MEHGDWSDIFTFSSGDIQRLEYHNSGSSLTWYSNNTNSGKFMASGTNIINGLTTKTWHHLILTFKNGTSRIYIDGVKKKELTGNTKFSSGADKLYIGSRIDGAYAKQYLNDLIFFDHALTIREAKKLAQGCFVHFNFSDSEPVLSDNLFPSNIINHSGGVGAYYHGVIANNVTKDGYKCFSITNNTTNNYPDGFITSAISLTEGSVYEYSLYVFIPSGREFRIGMRLSSGGNSENVRITGDGTWKYVSHKFRAVSGMNGSLEGSEGRSDYTQSTIYYIRNLVIRKLSEATYSNNALGHPEFSATGTKELIGKNLSEYGTDVLQCTNVANRDYISFPSPWKTGQNINETSVAIWFKNNSNTGSYCPLFFPNGGTNGIWLTYSCEGAALWEFDGKTGSYFKYAGGGELQPGWHYIVFTISGTTEKWYLDGTEVASMTISGSVTNNASNYYVGNVTNGWNGVMNAYIADVAVYCTALSANDIAYNYHSRGELHKNGDVTAVVLRESEENVLDSNGNATDYKYPFFSKNGKLTCRGIAEELVLSDGSRWVPVMHHNNKGGTNLFSASDRDTIYSKLVFHNMECWANFPLMNKYKYTENSTTWWEFLLFEQHDENSVSVRRRWKQKFDPLTTTSYDTAKKRFWKCSSNREHASKLWWFIQIKFKLLFSSSK